MNGLYYGGLAISVIMLYFLLKLNRLADLKKRAMQGWEEVETLLNKRHELFDRLAALKESKDEIDPAFKKVLARNRIAARHAFTVSEQQITEHDLLESVNKIIILLRNSSDVESDNVANRIIKDTMEIGVTIRNATHYYNGTVMEYNRQLSDFHSGSIAGLFGYGKMIFFEPEEEGVGV